MDALEAELADNIDDSLKIKIGYTKKNWLYIRKLVNKCVFLCFKLK